VARNPIITLTTDFGTNDHFIGTMKGVILSIEPDAQIIDICHSVQAFDVRFDTKDTDRVAAFVKSRYGAPVSETRDNIEIAGKAARQIYKVLWEKGDERAVLVAQPDKRRGTLSVSRGNFDEEIYRVR